jgi:L-lactate dehydrogenase complex protein LldG
MSSRDDILGRVRAALGNDRTEPEATDRRPYRLCGDHPSGDPRLVDLLVDRLEDYRAMVHLSTEAAIPDTVSVIIGAPPGRALGTDEVAQMRVVVPRGLPRDWLPDSMQHVVDDDLPVGQLETLDGVMTGAALAIAETGTIVLDASPDQGRRIITLVPDLHICVIRTDQIVGTVPEAIARLEPTRPMTWISGPSATSDIELDRVEGVHGPRQLHVVIVQYDEVSQESTSMTAE